MKLQFSATEAYQLDAIAAVVDLFEGQRIESGDFTITAETPANQLQLGGDLLVGNQLELDESEIIKSTQKIQKRNDVLPEDALFAGMHFSIEMETGTGKTYTYLRTIHELHKKYGFKKFVIVVPSVAIKEGTLKNLEITKDHFDMLYGKPKVNFASYESKARNSAKRNLIKSFARNDSLQILVLNIDSFTKDANVINQTTEGGQKPIEFLQQTNPIVIVDEPQNMETDIRKAAIANLNPLCTLRYSATHKHHYNLLYRLNPVQAYDLGLVKKIEIDSVYSEDAYNDAYIRVLEVKSKGRQVYTKVEIDKSDESGLQRKELKLKAGDDLRVMTGREVYEGFLLDEIDVAEQKITFANGKEYLVGQKDEGLREELVKYQIRQTVQNHFEKEKKLQDKGIKVLSLFFIDRVSNYRDYTEDGVKKGKFAEWFEEAYREMQSKPKFKGVLRHDVEKVHNGYFSADKKGSWKDTRGTTQADDDTYQLIMRDKEKLLNTETPLRFIFSHSALREGWDNPNVFQICTLNETHSEMKKRQEIGRGLRLPVDQFGERVRDANINILTVIANESYEDFAGSLQKEIEDECGVQFGGQIKNKKARRAVRLKKGFELDPNFKDLWERIKHKTRYHVTYKTDDLIAAAADILKEVQITKPKISSIKTRVDIQISGLTGSVVQSSGQSIDQLHTVIPDILGNIQRRVKLTKSTILEILRQSGMLKSILVNPEQLIDETVRVIEHELKKMMVDGIKYERIAGECFEMQQFSNEELESYLDKLVEVQDRKKTLYDHVIVDSGIESQFARDLENREDVKFYFKLPSWFKIQTPIGSYNPDWAVVFEDDKRVYFVAETKGTGQLDELSSSEQIKITCGKRHFAELDEVEFVGPVSTVGKSISKLKLI